MNCNPENRILHSQRLGNLKWNIIEYVTHDDHVNKMAWGVWSNCYKTRFLHSPLRRKGPRRFKRFCLGNIYADFKHLNLKYVTRTKWPQNLTSKQTTTTKKKGKATTRKCKFNSICTFSISPCLTLRTNLDRFQSQVLPNKNSNYPWNVSTLTLSKLTPWL
jgi:hypothetical protein